MNLQSLRKDDNDIFDELNEKTVDASLTGFVFSTIHSDLVTELSDKETKGTCGPFRCDLSTSIDLVNTWLIGSIHIPCLKLLKATSYILKLLPSMRSC